MAGIICDGGILSLNVAVANFLVAGYDVRLFTNNHTPAYSDVFSTYTEPTFGGYGAVSLSTPTDEGVTGNIDTIEFDPVTFTPTGGGLPETCYGYFISNGTVLIGAELFAVPIVVSTAGIGITITPKISYQDRSVA